MFYVYRNCICSKPITLNLLQKMINYKEYLMESEKWFLIMIKLIDIIVIKKYYISILLQIHTTVQNFGGSNIYIYILLLLFFYISKDTLNWSKWQ